jgi:hypothetical protein
LVTTFSAKLTIVTALSILAVACGKVSTGLMQNSEAKSASGWMIKVIETSQPATANIKARSPFGGTQPEKAEAPPANAKWVILQADLTPPSAAASLPAKQVRLVDASGAGYEAQAMAGATDKGAPAFVYIKESNGLGQVNAAGQLRWVVMENQRTGDIDIILQKAEVERVYFLFAVPSAVQKVSLQI